jgi:hypothetical protein
MHKRTNNYWQTLRKNFKRYRDKTIWAIVKLALVILRVICKLIDFFNGEDFDS